MENYNQNQIFGANVVENTSTHAISKNFVANVFLWMFIGLGLSAASAFLFIINPQWKAGLVTVTDIGAKLNILGWAVMLAPLVFVMIMSFGFARLSAPAITALFIVFSFIKGISFSFILLMYTSGSVLTCFLSAAAMFGVMAVLGYTTKKDLTSFGRIMMMGLTGIIIAIIINIFMRSGTMNMIISIIGVMVFTGLTAYDVQKLKRIGAGLEYEGVGTADVKKLSIIGALELYLDFINMFLFLLRLFGGKRD